MDEFDNLSPDEMLQLATGGQGQQRQDESLDTLTPDEMLQTALSGSLPKQRTTRLDEARQRQQGQGEGGLERVLRRAVPFVSTVARGVEGIRAQQAQQRIAANKAYDEDYDTVARYERLQQVASERGVGGKVIDAALGLPAIVGEGAVGSMAAGPIRAVQAGGVLPTLARGGAQLTVQTAAMPSMYLDDAQRRAQEKGGDWTDVENLAPAAAYGAIQTAVLGSLGKAPVKGIPTVAGRWAARTGIGLLESEAASVVGKLSGLTTKYGPLRELAKDEGDMGDAVAHVATFIVFSALHLGQDKRDRARAQQSAIEDFRAETAKLAAQGYSKEAAGRKLAADYFNRLSTLQQQAPAPAPEPAGPPQRPITPAREPNGPPPGRMAPVPPVAPEPMQRPIVPGREPLGPPPGRIPQVAPEQHVPAPAPPEPVTPETSGLTPVERAQVARSLGLTEKGFQKYISDNPEVARRMEDAVIRARKPAEPTPEERAQWVRDRAALRTLLDTIAGQAPKAKEQVLPPHEKAPPLPEAPEGVQNAPGSTQPADPVAAQLDALNVPARDRALFLDRLAGKSLEAVGKPLGISKEGARKAEQRVLAKLKEAYPEWADIKSLKDYGLKAKADEAAAIQTESVEGIKDRVSRERPPDEIVAEQEAARRDLEAVEGPVDESLARDAAEFRRQMRERDQQAPPPAPTAAAAPNPKLAMPDVVAPTGLFGEALKKQYPKGSLQQSDAFGWETWVDSTEAFAAKKGMKVAQREADHRFRIGKQWYETVENDKGEWEFRAVRSEAQKEALKSAQYHRSNSIMALISKAGGLDPSSSGVKDFDPAFLRENGMGQLFRDSQGRKGRRTPEDLLSDLAPEIAGVSYKDLPEEAHLHPMDYIIKLLEQGATAAKRLDDDAFVGRQLDKSAQKVREEDAYQRLEQFRTAEAREQAFRDARQKGQTIEQARQAEEADWQDRAEIQRVKDFQANAVRKIPEWYKPESSLPPSLQRLEVEIPKAQEKYAKNPTKGYKQKLDALLAEQETLRQQFGIEAGDAYEGAIGDAPPVGGESPFSFGAAFPGATRLTDVLTRMLFGAGRTADAVFRQDPDQRTTVPRWQPEWNFAKTTAANQMGARNVEPMEVATTGWAYLKHVGKQIANLWMLAQKEPDPFPTGTDGRTELANGQRDFKFDVIEKEMANPGSQPLTPEQRRFVHQVWIPTHEKMLRQAQFANVKEFRDENGQPISFDELLLKPYIHRATVDQSPVRSWFDTHLRPIMGGKPGARPRHRMERSYPTEAEGFDAGVRYKGTYEAVRDFIEMVNREVADTHLANDPVWGQGQELVTLGREIAPAFHFKQVTPEGKKHLERMFGQASGPYMKATMAAFQEARNLVLGPDVGYAANQLLGTFFSHNKAWRKGMASSFREFFAPGQLRELLHRDPNLMRAATEIVEAGGTINSLPEQISSLERGKSLIGSLPIMGPVWERFGRAFSTAMDVAKLYTWMAERPADKNEWPRAVEAVENALGQGRMEQLGMTPERAFLERSILLAPSYYRSFLKTAEQAMTQRGDPGKIARRNAAAMSVGVLATGVAAVTAARMLGLIDDDEYETRLNPSRGKFLMVPVPLGGGKTMEVGIGGIFMSGVRLMGNLQKWAQTDATNSTAEERKSPVSKWYRDHASIPVRMMFDLVTEEDRRGKELKTKDALANNLVPLAAQDALLEGGTARERVARAGTGMFGLKVWEGRSGPQNDLARIYELRNKFIREQGMPEQPKIPSQLAAMRDAAVAEDVEAFRKAKQDWMDRQRRMGRSGKEINASLKESLANMDPLETLSREDRGRFYASLDEPQRKRLQSAREYIQQVRLKLVEMWQQIDIDMNEARPEWKPDRFVGQRLETTSPSRSGR